jgi:hypothetical protein
MIGTALWQEYGVPNDRLLAPAAIALFVMLFVKQVA